MESLNNDCILYICTFLNTRDKINFIQTCKQYYNLGIHIFKNDCVQVFKENQYWIQKYKPKILSNQFQLPLFIKHVHNLDLCCQNIKYIPKIHFTYFSFDISMNKLSTFPTLSNSIVCLNISHNNIQVIKSISYLQNLKYLNISHCNLKELPSDISQLYNLDTLICHHNEIENIPNLHETEIKYIDTSHNQISKQFNVPKTCTSLYLAYNNLNDLEINHIYNILDVSFNKLVNLFSNYFIYELNASNNNICNIKVLKCKKLYIDSNNIQYLNLVDELDSLTIFDNPITQLPHFPNLEFLYKNENQNFTGSCNCIINE
jgi:Leucine-rich repeat (LRR) protein